jgi:hypothetical protein
MNININHNTKQRLVVLSIVFLIIVIYIAILKINPYWAALILREFKRRVEVYIMYGSTTGKVPLFFISITLSIIASLVLPKMHKKYEKYLLMAIIIFSLIIWTNSVYHINNVAIKYNLKNKPVGSHIQICDDGGIYNEVFSYEHPHSLKAVLHKVLLQGIPLISGEAFVRLYDFDITFPLIVILLSMLSYAFLLSYYKDRKLVYTFSLIIGYHAIFYSYFDGGVLAAGLSLVFLLLPQLDSLKIGKLTIEFKAYILLCILHLFRLIVQFVYYDVFNVAPNFGWLKLILPTTFSATTIVLSFLLIVILLQAKSYKRVILIVIVFIFFYLSNIDRWVAIDRWLVDIPKNEEVLVVLYTDKDVNFGEKLLESKLWKIVKMEFPETKTKYRLCFELLNEVEGVTYKSLAVSVYCDIFRTNGDYSNQQNWIGYVPLRDGICNIDCNQDLYKYFRIIKGNNEFIMKMADDYPSRTFGVPFCFQDIDMVISRDY